MRGCLFVWVVFRNLFANVLHAPDLEAFKPSAGRSESLFTATDLLSFNLTLKILSDDKDLCRQRSALGSSGRGRKATFL